MTIYCPAKKQLASTLLEKCHQELQSKINVHMKVATSCLTSNVWSNIKNGSIMSYMAVLKDCCLFLELCQQGSKDMTTNSLIGTSATSFATMWHINNICRHSDRQHFHKQEGMEAAAGGVPILILPWLIFSWTASPCQGHYCSIQYKDKQQRGGNVSNRLPL